MARKKAHEDHTNHEAWAIPYGDLVTLLLALFVVLYSMSSVNEGKYRVLSDSLNEAFGGRPRSPRPIPIGDKPQEGTNVALRVSPIARRGIEEVKVVMHGDSPPGGVENHPVKGLATGGEGDSGESVRRADSSSLQRMEEDVQKAMGELIAKHMIVVRRTDLWLEIEIRTDILFPSGVAQIADSARPVLTHLAEILRPFPNPIRIEGYTDNKPIHTMAFPSNWQLSAGRAASVVALFTDEKVLPTRLSVAGFGEYHAAASNDTPEGRNRNRRVLIVVLADPDPTRDAGLVGALATRPPADAAVPSNSPSDSAEGHPSRSATVAGPPNQAAAVIGTLSP